MIKFILIAVLIAFILYMITEWIQQGLDRKKRRQKKLNREARGMIEDQYKELMDAYKAQKPVSKESGPLYIELLMLEESIRETGEMGDG
jgi:hypothetical protein